MPFIKHIIIIIAVAGCINHSYSQQIRPVHIIGANFAHINYASVNEIHTPYIFSGSDYGIGIFHRKQSESSFQEFNINYAKIERFNKTVTLSDKFYIKGLDEGKTYVWKTEPTLWKLNTRIINFQHTYHRFLPFHVLPTDNLGVGITSYFELFLNPVLSEPELISISAGPNILYAYSAPYNFKLVFSGHLGILGLSIRKPYSGVAAQVTDTYNFQFFADYAIENAQFNYPSHYIRMNTRFSVEKALAHHWLMHISYNYNYVVMKKPRRLEVKHSIFEMGIAFKIR